MTALPPTSQPDIFRRVIRGKFTLSSARCFTQVHRAPQVCPLFAFLDRVCNSFRRDYAHDKTAIKRGACCVTKKKKNETGRKEICDHLHDAEAQSPDCLSFYSPAKFAFKRCPRFLLRQLTRPSRWVKKHRNASGVKRVLFSARVTPH